MTVDGRPVTTPASFRALSLLHRNCLWGACSIYNTVQYIQSTHITMTSSNGNIFRDTGTLWGEFTGYRWIPLTKTSDAELWCFFICAKTNGWANHRGTGDSRRHRAHYDVTVMHNTPIAPPWGWGMGCIFPIQSLCKVSTLWCVWFRVVMDSVIAWPYHECGTRASSAFKTIFSWWNVLK